MTFCRACGTLRHTTRLYAVVRRDNSIVGTGFQDLPRQRRLCMEKQWHQAGRSAIAKHQVHILLKA